MLTNVVKDPATVTADGTRLVELPPGVLLRRAITHVDDRGSVCEMFDPRWNWHPDPIVFSYMFTLRPNMVKGWGLHKLHDDRYFIVAGDLEVVFFDVREGSPTFNKVIKVVISEYERGLLSIPAGVWHADHNIGNKDVVVINFPTRPYDHANPDKYRLPIDTDQIPHSFGTARGW